MAIPRTKYNFTLIELLIAIVVIAVLYIMIFPVIDNAKKKAGSIDCLGNERTVSISVFMFAGDNAGRIKPDFRHSAVFNIDFVYQQYVKDAKTFTCRESDNTDYFVCFNDVTAPCDFAIFSPFCYADAFNLDKCSNPSAYRLVGEARPYPFGYFWFDKDICRWDMSARWRHFNMMNVVFMDGGGTSEEKINPSSTVPPYQR